MRSRRNQAKISILRFVEQYGPCTALDVAEFRGKSESCCSTQLGRFSHWGLLERYKVEGEGKTFYYIITENGVERADYLESHQSV